MLRYERKFRLLALAFSALAGFVDAIGFLKSGGLFVSFMTGNSTRLAIGATAAAPIALAAASLIVLFVTGVVLGVLLSARSRLRKMTSAAVVALLLTGAAIFETIGWDAVVIALLCLAMGACNTLFQRDGEVSVGVTYMTGNLVRLGHRIAEALRGGSRTAWLPYFCVWLSLVLGGIAGATGYLMSGTASLWGAAIVSVVLVWIVRRLSGETAA